VDAMRRNGESPEVGGPQQRSSKAIPQIICRKLEPPLAETIS
jgi:hypothetical protein